MLDGKKDYIERTLIRLKRRYGKDELVAALIKQNKQRDVEIGKLKAKIDYLQNELQSEKEQKEIKRLAKIGALKEDIYSMKIEENKKLQKEIKQLRRNRDDLIYKCSMLEKKTRK